MATVNWGSVLHFIATYEEAKYLELEQRYDELLQQYDSLRSHLPGQVAKAG